MRQRMASLGGLAFGAFAGDVGLCFASYEAAAIACVEEVGLHLRAAFSEQRSATDGVRCKT